MLSGPGGGRGRTLLVISEGIELAVALRDRVERAYLTVCDARPAEAVAAARDRPWMVVGEGTGISPTLVRALAKHPVLLLWLGASPPGLPAHVRAFERFSELAVAVDTAVSAALGGIRLAPGAGLTMPDGAHSGNHALEVLVASHPHPLVAPAADLRGAVSALASHGVALHVNRRRDGSVVLAATAEVG